MNFKTKKTTIITGFNLVEVNLPGFKFVSNSVSQFNYKMLCIIYLHNQVCIKTFKERSYKKLYFVN